MRGVPASSEKAIADAAAHKEEMEKQKVKEEEKLKDVMESLKEETSGLQQDKEVCDFSALLHPSLDLLPPYLLTSQSQLSSCILFRPKRKS